MNEVPADLKSLLVYIWRKSFGSILYPISTSPQFLSPNRSNRNCVSFLWAPWSSISWLLERRASTRARPTVYGKFQNKPIEKQLLARLLEPVELTPVEEPVVSFNLFKLSIDNDIEIMRLCCNAFVCLTLSHILSYCFNVIKKAS